MNTIDQNIEELGKYAADALEAVRTSKGISKSDRTTVERTQYGVRNNAWELKRQVDELRGTIPVKLVDVDLSIERISEKADAYEAFVAKHTGRLDYVIEVGVNDTVAKDLRSLCLALKASEGRPSGAATVEEPDPEREGRTRSVRYLSPEEHIEWRIEEAQKTVFQFVNGMNSRSTSESSRILEQVRAQAATETLEYLGGAPARAYGYSLVCWKELDA